MRTSHKKIKQRLLQEMREDGGAELFGSQLYRAYLCDQVDVLTVDYGRKITLQTKYEPESDATACTNGKSIFINTGNIIPMSFPTLELKNLSIMGFLAHEVAHLLFSSFNMLNLYAKKLATGTFYPKAPISNSAKETLALSEIGTYLKSSEDEDKRYKKALELTALNINNILEDAAVESQMCFRFPGEVRFGILMNHQRILELSSSIQKMIDDDMKPLVIIQNMILQYTRLGAFHNTEGYNGEYMETVMECIPFIDASKYSDDAKERLKATNQILLKLWPYIKEFAKNLTEDEVEQMESMMELEGASEDPKGRKGKPVEFPGFYDPSSANGQKDKEEIQEVLETEGARIKLVKSEIEEVSGIGSVIWNRDYKGSGYQKAAEDIHRLLNTLADERKDARYEQELTDELQAEANAIRLGNAHRGIHLTVNRQTDVPEWQVEQYKEIARPFLALGKRTSKVVKDKLEKVQRGYKLKGLLTGTRIETGSLYRKDKAIFSKKKLPNQTPPLVLALLLDESGSMKDFDRTTTARAAALALYEFCKSLAIPCLMMGHTTERTGVALFSYAEYKSGDGKDAYRLMDISARSCNRDGAALRYIAERLSKRAEPNKILIIISDGQPNDNNYKGTDAEADLRGIKKEYTRKGIQLYAGAIGADLEKIKRIYGECFLDLTDLRKLPQNLTSLMVRTINKGVQV